MQFYDNLIGHDLKDPQLSLNSRGHRCKEIEDVSFHGYILFAGDNVALDFNLPIEETFPHLISKKLGLDYYNLSIFNGGLDVLRYNLLTWCSRFPSPNMVVISTEFLNSLVTASDNGENLQVVDYSDERVNQIMSVGDRFGFFSARHLLAQNILLQYIDCPIYQITFKDKVYLPSEKITTIPHCGEIFDHKEITEVFMQHHAHRVKRILP